MPEPLSPPHVELSAAIPRVDFVCRWRADHDRSYVYRVPSHQFLLVEHGEIRALGGDGEVVARAGELLALKRQARNQYGYRAPTRYFELHARFAPPPHEATPLWLDGRPIPDLVRLGSSREAAQAAFATLCLELPRPGDAAQSRARAALYALLAAIAQATGGSARKRVDDPWQRARAVLESDLARPIAVADAAREVGVGEDHFIRGFRRRFGMSPMAFRAQAKLRWAATALSGGDAAVKEVAARLGFADASAFARAFRRGFGVSPSDWRVAGDATVPAPSAAPGGDDGYPLNRHLRPPDGPQGWFVWA